MTRSTRAEVDGAATTTQVSRVNHSRRWLKPVHRERCSAGLTAPSATHMVASTTGAARRDATAVQKTAAPINASVASPDAALWRASAVAPERDASVRYIPDTIMPRPAMPTAAATTRARTRRSSSTMAPASVSRLAPTQTKAAVIRPP